ncbi:hypothetical protein, partial [Sinorhizobium saheli]|uniref:hypothetical protein n=1 Tax=Sinorhizobium saheli TaxID=36856 RepID=UPI001AECD03C
MTQAVSSYLEMCRFLQLENAYENVETLPLVEQYTDNEDATALLSAAVEAPFPKAGVSASVSSDPVAAQRETSERVVFTEEGDPGQCLKLIASGEIDDYLLEALGRVDSWGFPRLSKSDSRLSFGGSHG